MALIEAGGEVQLVPRSVIDAADVFALVEQFRDDLRTWLTWVDTQRSVADARLYAQLAARQFAERTMFDYTIRERGAIVGSIGLFHLNWSSRCGEIGYWLAPPARGRGIMHRSVGALVSHAIVTLELRRIEIRCVVENAVSRAVAEGLGFTFEGTLNDAYLLHGAFRNIALYATTAARWHAGLRGARPVA